MVKKSLVVVAAVIESAQGILMAQRRAHQDLAHLWEFPGGKVEPGETAEQALARELDEELAIQIQQPQPLLRFDYEYPDKHIQFHIFRVRQFDGEAYGREGQTLAWLPVAELAQLPLPAANSYILSAIQQPPYCLITPEPPLAELDHWWQALERSVANGIQRLIFRAVSLEPEQYQRIAEQIITRFASVQVLVHGGLELLDLLPQAAGVHFPSALLMQTDLRPLGPGYLLSCACHNAAQLRQAEQIQADMALVSPVLPTLSHADATSLGWSNLSQLIRSSSVPVYALGGLGRQDYVSAIQAGAVGIAAIRGLWSS